MNEKAWVKAIINSADEVEFEKEAIHDLDVLKVDDNIFQLMLNNKNYTIKLLDKTGHKSFKVQINSRVYNIELKDHLDLMVDRLGLTKVAAQKINEIKAPMPGLVIDVLVKEGQSIQKGDSLVILEAMKMENVIKAAGDGIIEVINVGKGQAVEKNQVLLKLNN